MVVWKALKRTGVLCGLLLTASCIAQKGTETMPYEFEPAGERVPDKPWHTHFIDETRATPADSLNAGAAYMNDFLKASLDDRLQKTSARTPWREYSKFLEWAVWGYLSPDSNHQGDERLLTMAGEWLDQLFVRLNQKPEDPKKAEGWAPNRLDTWGFSDYSLPMLELEARPELAEKIGAERVSRYRAIILDNIRHRTTPEAWNNLLERSQTYINIATHPMAIYIHGWLLTGEEKYWRMAASLVAILGRDQLPNGMFPYRYRIYGEDHSEFEGMYYHAINVRALYMYWWATGSDPALDILEKSVPYYPLNMEPPYRFNDGPAIWWKNIWRTFWPQHIAMVAAATGDGENAKIALDMARDRVSHDRIDLTLGAHAYQLMALENVKPRPLRDRYVVRDPDIRGVRLRFSPWSSTFSTGSFTYTRASAMLLNDSGGFNALHMARPYLRVTPLDKKPRYEMDYSTLSRQGASFNAALTDNAAAAATKYRMASTAETWRDKQSRAPFDMTELWIMTEHGMIGIIDSRAAEPFEAYELNHQFRFIIGRNGAGKAVGDHEWECGNLKFRVWNTDFPAVVEERTRRYALAANQRIDWQVSLADMERLPEQIAQDGPPSPQTGNANTDAALPESKGDPKEKKLPTLHTIPADYSRFSIIEVSPKEAGFTDVVRIKKPPLLVLRGEAASAVWTAVYNPTDIPQEWQLPDSHATKTFSWTEAEAVNQGQLLLVPPKGIVLTKRIQ